MGSSRKANRTKSRVDKFATGSSGFSALSSKLSIVAVFFWWSIQSISVVSAWQSRRQQLLHKTATIKAPMEVSCEVIVDSFGEIHGYQPPLVNSKLSNNFRTVIAFCCVKFVVNGCGKCLLC